MLNRDDLLRRAELLRNQKRLKDAEQQVGIVLRDNPEDVDALLILAHCKIDGKSHAEAITILQQCLQYDANNDYIFYLLAFAYYQNNEVAQAQRYIDKAIAIFPYNAGYFSLLSHIRLSRKEYEAALEAANEGLEIDAESVACLNARSTALFRLNRKEEAYETINEALELDPEDYRTHSNYGWHYLEKGKHKQATNHFKEALRINPNFGYAREGYKAALKSRMPFYRWLLQYSIWMTRQEKGVRIAIVFGIWIAVRLIGYFGEKSPLKYVALSIVAIYLLLVIMSWLGDAFANLYLLFTPHGRYILNKNETWSAIMVGTTIAIGLALFIAALTINGNLIVVAALVASMSIPFNEIEFPIHIFKGKGRVVTAQIMVLLGIAASISYFINDNLSTFFAIIYGIFFVGFMWSNSIKSIR